MTTLLFLITFATNHCIVYLPNEGDYIDTFEEYNTIAIDVYSGDSLAHDLASQLFPRRYDIVVNDQPAVAQCN
jgi:hypothetical protein